MNKKHKRNIGFLIAGGTAVDLRKPQGSSIASLDQAADWLRLVQCFVLDANIVPHFFYDGEGMDLSHEKILEIAKFIFDHYDEYDGFVVSTGISILPLVSSALAFLLGQLGKPVVVTGTPISYHSHVFNAQVEMWKHEFGSLGPRSNILGACQVALSGAGEVCVVYGNKIFSPTRLVLSNVSGMNFFETREKEAVGRVDFSIRNYTMKPRANNKESAVLSWNSNIITMDLTFPSSSVKNFSFLQKADALVFRSFLGEFPRAIHKLIAEKSEIIPCIIYTPLSEPIRQGRKFDQCLWVENITPETLLTKIMWVLGQTKDPKMFSQLFFAPRGDEFL